MIPGLAISDSASVPPMWTLEEAIPIVREVEKTLLKYHQYHCCLGGSVLMRGSSYHDLDIFIYPHNTENAPTVEQVYAVITLCGYPVTRNENLEYLSDQKYLGNYKRGDGKRIDFFYLNHRSQPKTT